MGVDYRIEMEMEMDMKRIQTLTICFVCHSNVEVMMIVIDAFEYCLLMIKPFQMFLVRMVSIVVIVFVVLI